MKKLLKLLIFLFLIYLLFQLGFSFFSKGHTIEYNIKGANEFSIKEVQTKNMENEQDNYYFEITINDTLFSIQTYKDYKNASHIIKSVSYYKDDNYECIMPIDKNNNRITDVICLNNGIYYYYNSIKGMNSELDKFVLKLDYYNQTDYNDNDEILKQNDSLILYTNINPSIYIGIENYKGVYMLNKTMGISDIQIFNNDTYSKSISGYVKKNYVVADYNEEYEFHNFYVVNLLTHSKSKIVSNNAISMYSYVQGVVDNSMYIIDTVNKKQYEINIKTKQVKEIGNIENGVQIYKNNVWEKANIYDVIEKSEKFSDYNIQNDYNNVKYEKVEKTGNQLSGYYYLYKKNNNNYDVYRINVQNSNVITYLFTTTNISDVIYDKDLIIYKDGEYIKYFNDLIGNKKIIKYNELIFNNSLKIGIYR